MYDVSIKLLCTRKSGILSRAIREIKLLGLQYQSHKIHFSDGRSSIVINAHGELNCTRESLKELFGNLPEVLSVDQIRVTHQGKEVKKFQTRASEAHIAATERITPAIVLAAEKRLSQILGPVASFIVENSAQECANAGDLFALLAEELNDTKEREYFLSIIDSGR